MEMEYLNNLHVSVDCVVFGFDGEKLKVILIERNIQEKNELYSDKKLPGSIILQDEDLDEAANRVLTELTGLKNIYLRQFKSFGHPSRTSNPRDVKWLESTTNLKIGRIVNVAYFSLIKIDRKIVFNAADTSANWFDVKEISKIKLAFDHNKIIADGMEHIRNQLTAEPKHLLELLPKKFTIAQLRILYDVIHQTRSDARNFRKKVAQMDFLLPLDEYEQGVPYRAARLYKYKK
jgi:8-oxo-dGTP diphosphatase